MERVHECSFHTPDVFAFSIYVYQATEIKFEMMLLLPTR